MPLNDRQREGFKTFQWLFSRNQEDRRTGRTYLLALAYLYRSQFVREWIDVEDHHDNSRGLERHLLQTIVDIARQHGAEVDIRRSQFMLVHTTPALRIFLEECGAVQSDPIPTLIHDLTAVILYLSASPECDPGGSGHTMWRDFGEPKLRRALEWLHEKGLSPRTEIPPTPDPSGPSLWNRLRSDD